ncbi:hypothetical protein BTN49_1746 [Candidatus Enterovibrio escicola]|uniref:Uncharacterized protein n=1 Tax=Candidatus Enterovibrio escicola TaxID=1927127 RepID=A0A2A5T2X3_9GAMM|nr:hypothetical protein BTN49_1746 [Candidatus Enterovibrio escacola]
MIFDERSLNSMVKHYNHFTKNNLTYNTMLKTVLTDNR